MRIIMKLQQKKIILNNNTIVNHNWDLLVNLLFNISKYIVLFDDVDEDPRV